MDKLTIGDLARAVGVAPSAIRYYEQIGLLPEPERESGQRRYREDVLWRLSLIQQSKQAGFTLHEIDLLLNGFEETTAPARRWQELAGQKLSEIDRQIAELERSRACVSSLLDCSCKSLTECANAAADSRG